jgi:hypothetical protein
LLLRLRQDLKNGIAIKMKFCKVSSKLPKTVDDCKKTKKKNFFYQKIYQGVGARLGAAEVGYLRNSSRRHYYILLGP